MSESVATSGGVAWRGDAVLAEERWAVPDQRRRLQLVLGGIWLLDAEIGRAHV